MGDGALHMRLMVGFLVLNCPRVDMAPDRARERDK